MSNFIEIEPYVWAGPYSQWRSDAPHDARLCAEIRAPWMGPEERLIVRTCEIVGYPDGFLYDDHFPPSEPEGRGKAYKHIPFKWDPHIRPDQLTANCVVPGVGRFTLELQVQSDHVDFTLSVRNDLNVPMGPIDWSPCIIAYECPTLQNPEHDHTYLYQGERLRSLKELGGDSQMRLYNVEGTNGFVPKGHLSLPPGPVRAEKPLVVLESESGQYTAALAFEHAYSIYSCRGNKCFHADPYFGVIAPGQENVVRGKLYLIEGNAQQAFERYTKDFLHH